MMIQLKNSNMFIARIHVKYEEESYPTRFHRMLVLVKILKKM